MLNERELESQLATQITKLFRKYCPNIDETTLNLRVKSTMRDINQHLYYLKLADNELQWRKIASNAHKNTGEK